jgi:hypothetical protein
VVGALDVRGVELSAMDEGPALEDLDISEDAEADEMDEMEGIQPC